jgi:hypothetical protein
LPNGYLTPSPEYVKHGSVAITTARTLAPWAGHMVSTSQAGSRTDTQPVTEPAEARVGHNQPMFGFADWYNRIHLSKYAVDVGSVVNPLTENVVVWNAWLVPRTLLAVTPSNADGIDLTQPGATPFGFEPLRERTYAFYIDTEGPAVIDASYLFDFDVVNLTLPITGQRIVAWVWRPDWSQTLIERLEWKTDVLTAYDGTEQRIKLREYPRRTFEFAFAATGRQRRRLDSMLYGWGARQWALPIWPDGEQLSAQVAIGATQVMCTTATRDYYVGGLMIFLGDDGSYEAVEIDEVQADRLILARATEKLWPALTTMIFPARLARLPATHGFSRFTHDAVYGPVRMEVDENSAWTAASETTYRGRPVLTEKPNWIEDISVEYLRKLASLDYGTGPAVYHDESGVPEIRQTHRWFLDGRAEIAAFRAWLYARAGKYGALWVPTWADDMILADTIGAAATTVDIENIDYHQRIDAGENRQDIRIELRSGAVHYRRITAAQHISDQVERLTIDSALGVQVTPADVVAISYMALCRLDTDGVEISYFSGETAEAAHSVRAIGHDV